MKPPPNLSPALQEIAHQALRRAETIRVQRERIEAARMRLWERVDRLHGMRPRPAADASDAQAPGFLTVVEPTDSLLDIAAEPVAE